MFHLWSPKIAADCGGLRRCCVGSVPRMEEPVKRRFKIGYALASKKKNSFIQSSLVVLAAGRGIDLVPIDIERLLLEQGPFDCVIHKVPGEAWRSQLRDYAERNPGVPIVDDPDAIERLRNRISMLQVVSELRIPQQTETFGIPKQIVVYNCEALSYHSEALSDLRFPVIAKPLVSDGSAKSHKMTLVFNREALMRLKPPVVLQEFVNHGGVIFKVYVVGDYVKCMKRKSLPDVTEEKLQCAEGSVSFSQVSNMTTAERTEEKYYKTMQLEDAEMPPPSFIGEIARGLRKELGMHLFNFDVIRDVKVGNHYLVIDINYFPGYAKMPCYETVLTDFFWEIVNRNSMNGSDSVAAGALVSKVVGEEVKIPMSNLG